MSITDLMNSEAGVTMLGTSLGALWTFIQSRRWYRRLRRRRYTRAIQALEAGIDKTYREYVSALKKGREDGKLTQEEAKIARRRARRTAIEYGTTTGVDVLRALGETYIDLWITKLIQKAKQQA